MKHSFFKGAQRLSALALCLCLILIPAVTVAAESESPGYIRWVDFSVTQKALSDTARLDIEAHESGAAVSWIDLLSLLAAKNGGNFGSYKTKDAEALAQKLREGKSPEELCKNQKLFAYYRQAYSAILGGMLGPGTRVETDENGHEVRTAFYGLRAFSPLAQGYSYVEDAGGHALTDADTVQIGEALSIHLYRGSLKAAVTEIRKQDAAEDGLEKGRIDG